MVNDMNAFELTDEQLGAVAGGVGNGASVSQSASADQENVAIGNFKNSTVGGSPTIFQGIELNQLTSVTGALNVLKHRKN